MVYAANFTKSFNLVGMILRFSNRKQPLALRCCLISSKLCKKIMTVNSSPNPFIDGAKILGPDGLALNGYSGT